MVTAAQHIRHAHATEVGRAGVVRVLEQKVAVAFLHQRRRRTDGARQQTHHPIDDRHRRQLTTGEHKIPQRHLLIGQGANALIEALVMAAQHHQLVVVVGPALQIGLLQGLPLRTHQQHPPPGQHRNRFKGGISRFWLQHHPGATPIGDVIHLAVLVGGVVAGIVEVQLGNASSKGTTDHPQLQQG